MARTEKLLARLAQLENEFAELLAQELNREATGGHSTYLARKIPRLLDGKRFRRPEVGHIEQLERQLRGLGLQLGEPLDTGPLAVLDKYLKSTASVDSRMAGRLTRVARIALAQLTGPSGGQREAKPNPSLQRTPRKRRAAEL
jgi:hypothetical protein